MIRKIVRIRVDAPKSTRVCQEEALLDALSFLFVQREGSCIYDHEYIY